MADVTINYRSTAIATMNASGSVSLDTSGKYCDSDIEVVYEQPSGGASWTVANATRDTSYQGAIFTAPSGCTALPAAYILYTTAAMSSVSGSPAITILKDSTHNLMWYYESGSVKVKTVSTGDFSVWYQDGKIYFDDDNTYGLASNTNVGLICVYGQTGTVTFRTKTHTPASNSTTATFATEEEPAMFVCGLDATVSLNSTHKVQTVVYSDDVNVFSGTNFYTSNIGYYTNFTESYSSSTLTLTSYSSSTSGYFNSGSQYTLYYLLSGDLSNSTNLGEKTITTNGTYNASTDGYDGYSKVVANVPNTYTNADEGKVVDNGALVAQTAHADVTPTTSDQTIDTTTNNSIKVKGDADLVAGNIKKDVEIFGVTGSYEGSGGMAVQQGSFTPATDSNKLQITFASPISYLLVYLDPDEYSAIIADTSGVRRLIQYVRTPDCTMKSATNTGNAIHTNGIVSGGPLSAISSIDDNLWPSTAGSGYLMGGYTYKWIAW